ncbi:MAG TPA: DNA-binding response regulator [Solibacterales bacterium]|nr:DNA-binding response regulator [Bryobacterales bacterium]
MTIRVLLVEDEAMIRAGIRGLLDLTPDIKVVAECADGEDAWDRLATAEFDLLLLDIRLPRLSGIELLERIRARGVPAPPALLLTTFDDDEALLRGVRAGARGYLLKASSFEDLTGAIRAVASGQSCIRPAVTDRAHRLIQNAEPASGFFTPIESLTPREAEILRLMAGGFSNREIADALRMSEGTVKNHSTNIFLKLGVRDRVRAVLKGIEVGLV